MNTRNVFGTFLKDIKKVVKENNNHFSDLIIGTVVSTSPLQVKIDVLEGTLILDKEFLSLTTLVLDFEVDADIIFDESSVWTEPKEDPKDKHAHRIKGRKDKQKLKIYLGLKQGEKVLLLRVSQGQKFIVLDRLR